MIKGGVVPCGNCLSCVWELAVIWATALSILTPGWKNTFTTAIPYSDCDSTCWMLSTTVVMLRSVIETILSANSCGGSPLKVQMTLTTGISMFGKMSIGVRTIYIFPNIDIPVVSVIWTFNGLPPQELADRIVSITERNMTTVVDNIQHVESQSLYGIAVVKVFFQPGVSIDRAVAQITASSQTQLRQLPQGTTPPLIITYSASTVPILQLGLSGQGMSEQALNDYGLNFIRTQLVTVPGTAVPYPYGGKQREVQVDLNTAALQSKGLS